MSLSLFNDMITKQILLHIKIFYLKFWRKFLALTFALLCIEEEEEEKKKSLLKGIDCTMKTNQNSLLNMQVVDQGIFLRG